MTSAAGRVGPLPAATGGRGALGRRARTVPMIFIGFLAATVALPVLLVAALATDVVRRRRLVALRLVAMLWVYLAAEALGILALFGIWLAAGPPGETRRRRIVDWTYAVQRAWATVLLRALRRAFSLRVEVEGPETVTPGPVLVLMRHASIVDTLLPAALVTRGHGIRLRYVLKRELLWDPCLDIAGNRLPNAFVGRGAGDPTREIARVRALARDLGPRDGVLIYPEGKRFTVAVRQQVLDRLSERGGDLYERGRRMTNVLPPRLGGTLALLEGAPGVDVVLCAHHGLDGLARIADVWSGDLVGRTIKVRFWRRSREAIPVARHERVDWLLREWELVDHWVGARD
jgi:1-acyl-sn-glycerol-3-phosphate acyltransferase